MNDWPFFFSSVIVILNPSTPLSLVLCIRWCGDPLCAYLPGCFEVQSLQPLQRLTELVQREYRELLHTLHPYFPNVNIPYNLVQLSKLITTLVKTLIYSPYSDFANFSTSDVFLSLLHSATVLIHFISFMTLTLKSTGQVPCRMSSNLVECFLMVKAMDFCEKYHRGDKHLVHDIRRHTSKKTHHQ